MELSQYLRSSGVSQEAFAALCGVTQGMVNHWTTGRKRVSAERAIQIERATNGAVCRHELRPDLFESPAPQAEEAGA